MKLEEWKRLISSTDPALRSAAADCVPEDGDRDEVLSLLLKSLDDEDVLVRAAAADTLGSFPVNQVRIKLRERVQVDADALARSYAASSLGDMENCEDVPLLTQILTSDPSELVKAHAALALVNCSLACGLGKLGSLANTQDEYVRSSAFSFLDSLSERLEEWRRHIKSIAESAEYVREAKVTQDHIDRIISRED